MSPQISRLQKDSKELKHYLYRLEKQGNKTMAHKTRSKLEYLNSRIEELEGVLH